MSASVSTHEPARDPVAVDLDRIRSEDERAALRRALDETGNPWREVCDFWTRFEAADPEGAPEGAVVVAHLAEIVDTFRQMEAHAWITSLRRLRPYFLALWRGERDHRAGGYLDALLRHSDQRLLVCRPEDDGEPRACLARALAAASPHALHEVRCSGPDDALWIHFSDGLSGALSLEDLGLAALRNRLVMESATVGPHGQTLELVRQDGELFEIDAAALRTLMDPSAAGAVRDEAVRSDEAVGHRIRKARRTRGITQTDLGQRAGLDQAVISRLERGRHRPRIDTLRRIARGLDLTVSELLAG